MKKYYLGLVLLSLLLIIGFPRVGTAATVMEKAARTGILTVITQKNAIPYSYFNDKEELVGYSIDLINLIKQQLEKDLGKEITLQVVFEKDFGDRINQITAGQADLACNTGFTWERNEFVDFSLSYSLGGVKLLVNKDSNLNTAESLAGKKVAVQLNTIAAQTIKTIQPQAIIVTNLATIPEAFEALNKGEIDAIAGDLLILEGIRQTNNPEAYKLVPESSYTRNGVACMVAEGNSNFLNTVNYSIARLMQGYLVNQPQAVEIINKWFGPEGVTPTDPKFIRELFEFTIVTREQIPLQIPKS